MPSPSVPGNALLLVLCLILREVPPSGDPAPDPYPSRWPLSAFHYPQLLVALEFIALMPVLIQYLREYCSGDVLCKACLSSNQLGREPMRQICDLFMLRWALDSLFELKRSPKTPNTS